MASLEATRDYCLTIRTPAKAGRAKRMRMDCLPWVHERPTLSSNQKEKTGTCYMIIAFPNSTAKESDHAMPNTDVARIEGNMLSISTPK